MPKGIEAVSDALAETVERAGRSVVRVEGRRRGGASGILWDQGVIVAAHHSVEADEAAIGWPDGSTSRAQVSGRDPSTDLVVLRAESGAGETPRWDDAVSLKPGHLVVAALRPGRTVRAAVGSVNAVGEEWRAPAGGRIDRYVQLDISLQPGLSGALLSTASGRPVGIVTSGLLRSTPMLLPKATVARVVQSVLDHGHVRRGYLGIGTYPVRLPGANGTGDGEPALLVVSVQPGASAAQAGLLIGDALLTFDGRRLTSPADLLPLLEGERIGAEVPVRLVRAGEPRELTVRIGAREQAAR
jgi:S1-C subfamily serine protease